MLKGNDNINKQSTEINKLREEKIKSTNENIGNLSDYITQIKIISD
jgi:hypothetical protein